MVMNVRRRRQRESGPTGAFSAGKSVTLKAADGAKEISSNVTFVVMDWVSGRLANNGLILVPSEQDLVDSAARFGFDKSSLKLRIEWSE
jgi:hypothetical protein